LEQEFQRKKITDQENLRINLEQDEQRCQ